MIKGQKLGTLAHLNSINVNSPFDPAVPFFLYPQRVEDAYSNKCLTRMLTVGLFPINQQTKIVQNVAIATQ